MRILQLAPIWETVPPPGYGGTEAVVSALTEELVRRGIDVTLCASGDSRTSARLFSVYPASLRSKGLMDDALQYSLVHVAQSLALAGDHDLVHIHCGPPSDLGMALSHLVKTPVLATFHNHPEESSKFIWTHYAGWYNAISNHQASVLPRLPLARYAGAVHNAIDVDSFPFQTAKSDYAFFIGRMIDDKAPHLAIEAARAAGIRIVLAGKMATAAERDYFDARIRPFLSDPGVEYVGEADATLKRELYRSARCVLVPSQWDEPFGLVMIEAMACGTPPIVFRRGAAPEIVTHGETGFLVRDVASMAAAIANVDTISPLACRTHVEARFSPASLADRYLAVYENMLNQCETPMDVAS